MTANSDASQQPTITLRCFMCFGLIRAPARRAVASPETGLSGRTRAPPSTRRPVDDSAASAASSATTPPTRPTLPPTASPEDTPGARTGPSDHGKNASSSSHHSRRHNHVSHVPLAAPDEPVVRDVARDRLRERRPERARQHGLDLRANPAGHRARRHASIFSPSPAADQNSNQPSSSSGPGPAHNTGTPSPSRGRSTTSTPGNITVAIPSKPPGSLASPASPSLRGRAGNPFFPGRDNVGASPLQPRTAHRNPSMLIEQQRDTAPTVQDQRTQPAAPPHPTDQPAPADRETRPTITDPMFHVEPNANENAYHLVFHVFVPVV